MDIELEYKVVLEDIDWDFDDYDFAPGEERPKLPERMEFFVLAYDEEDAINRALEEASDETGWLFYGSTATATKL